MVPLRSHSQTLSLLLPDAAATRALGDTLAHQLPVGTVLLLRGDLGSGKTTLVQGLGKGLGIEEIDSPTFTLINEYRQGRSPLYHIDLYRLTPEQADALTLESYWDEVETEPGIVAIEWSERLSYLPDNPIEVALSYVKDGSAREAVITVPAGLDLSFDDFAVVGLK